MILLGVGLKRYFSPMLIALTCLLTRTLPGARFTQSFGEVGSSTTSQTLELASLLLAAASNPAGPCPKLSGYFFAGEAVFASFGADMFAHISRFGSHVLCGRPIFDVTMFYALRPTRKRQI